MIWKKIVSIVTCAIFFLSASGIAAAAAVPETVQAKLAAVEVDTYGSVQRGAIIDRINQLETDYDGRHSSGSMMQRVSMLYDNLYENAGGPSLMTRLNAIEWGLSHEVGMDPVEDRITELETSVIGKIESGTFRSRISYLGDYAFGSGTLPITEASVPANTLIKIALVDPLNAEKVREGDTVRYQVASDVIIDGVLLFAKGAPGEGKVTRVKHAKNFGRNAQIDIDFQTTKAMDGTAVDTFLGDEAKEEMKQMAMAAGASVAGIVLLGPIGVIGGAFVKGKNVDVPAGTEMYIQTEENTVLYGVETTTVR